MKSAASQRCVTVGNAASIGKLNNKIADSGKMNRYPMFNPQLLLSFVAVCDSNSFTRAAERVFLSQSTVSQQVRRLEEMLGKPLFERSSHQVLLTEEGVKLLSYARRIIALNEGSPRRADRHLARRRAADRHAGRFRRAHHRAAGRLQP